MLSYIIYLFVLICISKIEAFENDTDTANSTVTALDEISYFQEFLPWFKEVSKSGYSKKGLSSLDLFIVSNASGKLFEIDGRFLFYNFSKSAVEGLSVFTPFNFSLLDPVDLNNTIGPRTFEITHLIDKRRINGTADYILYGNITENFTETAGTLEFGWIQPVQMVKTEIIEYEEDFKIGNQGKGGRVMEQPEIRFYGLPEEVEKLISSRMGEICQEIHLALVHPSAILEFELKKVYFNEFQLEFPNITIARETPETNEIHNQTTLYLV